LKKRKKKLNKLKKAEVEGLELHQQKEREYLYNLEKIRREVREAKILRKAEEEKKKTS